MTSVITQCDRTWRRLGVASNEIESMRDQLAADLAEAEGDGVSAEAFVGGDPAGFARAWASARGVIRPRWRIVSTVVMATLGALPGVAVAFALPLAVTSGWLIDMVDPDNASLNCDVDPICGNPYLNVPDWVASWYLVALIISVLGSLAAVSAWLRRCADPARRRTLTAIAIGGPMAALLAAIAARIYDEAWGSWGVDGHRYILREWPSVFVVLMLASLGALRWWAVLSCRTGGPLTDPESPELAEVDA